MSVQLHAPSALPPGKEPRYLLDTKLGRPQNRSGRSGEQKNPALRGLEHRPFGCQARSQLLYRLCYSGSKYEVYFRNNWLRSNTWIGAVLDTASLWRTSVRICKQWNWFQAFMVVIVDADSDHEFFNGMLLTSRENTLPSHLQGWSECVDNN
jgi:hypothetical protein